MKSNKEKELNLIERILILGAESDSDLKNTININDSIPSFNNFLPTKIIEEYKSNNLIDKKENYLDNINMVK